MALKTTKGAIGEKKLITHGMGVQIPHSLGTEAAAEGDRWEVVQGASNDTEEVMRLQGGRDYRREFMRGPCPHVCVDTPEVCGIDGGGLPER